MMPSTFEYSGYHFTPFMKLTGAAGELANITKSINYKSKLFKDYVFSYDDFCVASQTEDCDLFKCVENGKLYIPSYNLFEYKGELHGIDTLL